HRGCCCAQPAPCGCAQQAPACGCGCGSSVAPSTPTPAPAPTPAAPIPPAPKAAQSPGQTYESFSAEPGLPPETASSAAPTAQPAPSPYVSSAATLSNDSTQNNPGGVSMTAPITGSYSSGSSVGSTQNNPSGTASGGFYYGGGSGS